VTSKGRLSHEAACQPATSPRRVFTAASVIRDSTLQNP